MSQPESETVTSGAPAGADRPRVEFYVLDQASGTARLKLACRLAEKAYQVNQTVLLWHTDPEELRMLDDLLWTFDDRSFVPHERLAPGASVSETPVWLSGGALPPGRFDVLINLAPDIPSCFEQAPRIAEIIDGDDARRRAGRARFKAYRDLGLQPVSHNIRSEQV
jgi:DNA polymerase-3 subunit chi